MLELNPLYRCKGCGQSYREGDLRERYSTEKKLRVIRWYLEGVGIMSIGRMENVPNPLIIKWIRKFSKIYSKAIDMIYNSILLLFNKNLLLSIFS